MYFGLSGAKGYIMKSVVVGTGRMGSAIAYAMHSLGHDLCLVDQTQKSFDYFKSLMGSTELERSTVDFHPVMNLQANILILHVWYTQRITLVHTLVSPSEAYRQ